MAGSVAAGLTARAIDTRLETWLLDNLDSQGRIVGHGYQAIARQIPSEAGDLVVKSPHPNNPLLAVFGRRTIRREARVYERLAGIPGVPKSYGLAAGEHLVLECIEGPTLRQAAETLNDRAGFFDRLLATLEAMHAAGVAHGDLKRKENTLVGPGEVPHIIDFGVACLRRERGGWWNRKRFETTRQIDLNAYIKLKYGTRPAGMTPGDAALHRPLLIERWARRLRGPWQFISMREARKRRSGRA